MERNDSDSDIRFAYIDQIVTNFLEKTAKKNEGLFFEIKYHPEKLRIAIEDYYKDLSFWRSYFQVPERLDRHKVGALVSHYFLINNPIEKLKARSRIGIVPLINEIVAWNICLSRLDDSGLPIKLEPTLLATYFKIAKEHSVIWNQGAVNDSDRLRLRFFSVCTFLFEQNHKFKTKSD